MNNFLVSVIIPVYNSEQFLEECLESIIKQDIGFSNSIELILIDDGSTDDSHKILLLYKEKYPENVIVLKQENLGVSLSRNAGLELASGDFIIFIDSDDYVTQNFIGSTLKYFDSAPDEVDVAVLKIKNIDSAGKYYSQHYLNKKFDDGTRTVNLNNSEWFHAVSRVTQCVFKGSAARKHSFDPNVKIFEDMKYVNEIIAESMLLGIVNEGTYFYRNFAPSNSEASITTGATKTATMYVDTPKYVSLHLLNFFKTKEGDIPHYAQFVAMCETRWRTLQNTNNPVNILSNHDYAEYKSIEQSILALLSDEAIIHSGLFNFWQRIYLLSLKRGRYILPELHYLESGKLILDDHVVFNIKKEFRVSITDIYFVLDELVLKGTIFGILTDDSKFCVKANNNICQNITLKNGALSASSRPVDCEEFMCQMDSFVVKIPLSSDIEKVAFSIIINERELGINKIRVAKSAWHTLTTKKCRDINGYIIRHFKTHLTAYRSTPTNKAHIKISILKKKFKSKMRRA